MVARFKRLGAYETRLRQVERTVGVKRRSPRPPDEETDDDE
jgi:hypothetical protein